MHHNRLDYRMHKNVSRKLHILHFAMRERSDRIELDEKRCTATVMIRAAGKAEHSQRKTGDIRDPLQPCRFGPL
jgi:hypothetical protein